MQQEEIDYIVASLEKRKCPLHSTGMTEIEPFRHPDGSYIRHRFRCPVSHCQCRVDFVDGEFKTDSVAFTLQFVIQADIQIWPE